MLIFVEEEKNRKEISRVLNLIDLEIVRLIEITLGEWIENIESIDEEIDNI